MFIIEYHVGGIMKKEGFDFFQNRACEYFHVTKGLQMRILTVCSVIVRCICLAMSAEAILSICQMVLKIVLTVRFLIAEKDMHM